MKKCIVILSIIFTLLLGMNISVLAEEGENNGEEQLNLAPEAKSAILMERDTGEILFDKNADEKLPPASMTKVMTLLLIMEELESGNLTYEETIRVSERAASMGGSQVFLEEGEEMTVKDRKSVV